jgi:hypothetical protein
MDSLFNILSSKNFDEPPEMSSIKKYIQEKFEAEVTVQVRDKDIVIIVPSAAFAGSLRMRVPEMKRRCQLTKRITIRIGG